MCCCNLRLQLQQKRRYRNNIKTGILFWCAGYLFPWHIRWQRRLGVTEKCINVGLKFQVLNFTIKSYKIQPPCPKIKMPQSYKILNNPHIRHSQMYRKMFVCFLFQFYILKKKMEDVKEHRQKKEEYKPREKTGRTIARVPQPEFFSIEICHSKVFLAYTEINLFVTAC